MNSIAFVTIESHNRTSTLEPPPIFNDAHLSLTASHPLHPHLHLHLTSTSSPLLTFFHHSFFSLTTCTDVARRLLITGISNFPHSKNIGWFHAALASLARQDGDTHADMLMHSYAHTHTNTMAFAHVQLHTLTSHTCIHMHACTYTFTYTHVHTHMQAHALTPHSTPLHLHQTLLPFTPFLPIF